MFEPNELNRNCKLPHINLYQVSLQLSWNKPLKEKKGSFWTVWILDCGEGTGHLCDESKTGAQKELEVEISAQSDADWTEASKQNVQLGRQRVAWKILYKRKKDFRKDDKLEIICLFQQSVYLFLSHSLRYVFKKVLYMF